MDNSQFIRALVKAALSALFAIGVKSPEYVERFSVAFQNALEKNLTLIQPQTPVNPPVELAPNAPQSPTTNDNLKADISVLVENTMIQKALRAAGINTVEQLVMKGQQEDYAKIKGIGRKSADEITERLKKWNS